MIRALALALGVCVALSHSTWAYAANSGDTAPSFHEKGLDGKPLSLAGQKGKVVLLNFWATWCAPCVKEIPALVRLQSALPVTQFTVVAIAQDLEAAEVNEFLKKSPVNFPTILDDENKIARSYGVRGLPVTYLIAPDGKIVERIMGPKEWDSAEWIDKIRRLIAR